MELSIFKEKKAESTATALGSIIFSGWLILSQRDTGEEKVTTLAARELSDSLLPRVRCLPEA